MKSWWSSSVGARPKMSRPSSAAVAGFSLLWLAASQLLLLLIALAPCPARGLTCPSLDTCDPATQCKPPVACQGGLVKDVCQCCDACAKVRGEECGGLHGLKGQCDRGLVCVLQHVTHAVTSDEDGVCLEPGSACPFLQRFVGCNEVDGNCNCQETLSCEDPLFQFASREDCYRSVALSLLKRTELPSHCHNVSCENILPSCPVDSMPRYGPVPAGECCAPHGTCLCDPLRCQVPKCDSASHELVLKKKATDRPGECCDVYECIYSGANCSLVSCLNYSGFSCPEDSYALPRVLLPDGCCSKPQGCACLPTPCSPVECPLGQWAKIIQAGDGTPGRCCNTFHCIKDGEPTCQYNGVEYVEGETWKVDKCTSCTCKGNVTSCSSVQCNVTSYCDRMEVPEGECCEICTGCMSSSGAAFDNGEKWQEDDCTTCTCINGKMQCHAEFCSVQCTNPRRIPGQCCPHCDEPLIVTTPPKCPPLDVCPELCLSGHQKDANGCFICACRLDGCNLQCDYGYETDDDGKAMCKCHCPELENCDKKCIHGFKNDASGCKMCKCAKCRSLKCAKKCPYGHVLNDRACRTCKCLNGTDGEVTTTDAHFYNITTEITDTLVEAETTLWPESEDGACETSTGLRDEGEMWHDGCRNCYCHAGREMCGLIHCPKPNCEHPIYFSGDCCPNCLETDLRPPSANITVCHSVDHTYRVEGETWELDQCTSCICHSGQVLCSGKECPPAACSNPTKDPNNCCPKCPESVTNSTAVCLISPDGPVYASGFAWQVDDCRSCRCAGGETECFSTRCPKLNCSVAVILKGKCCPQCLSNVKHSPLCLHSGIQYVSGERWSEGDCLECVCIDGQAQCHEKSCVKECYDSAVHLREQCCSTCTDSTSTSSTRWPETVSGSGNMVPSTIPKDDFDYPTITVVSNHSVVIGLSVALACIFAILVVVLVCCYTQHRKNGRLSPRGKVGDRNEAPLIIKSNSLNGGMDLNNKTFAKTNGRYKPVSKV